MFSIKFQYVQFHRFTVPINYSNRHNISFNSYLTTSTHFWLIVPRSQFQILQVQTGTVSKSTSIPSFQNERYPEPIRPVPQSIHVDLVFHIYNTQYHSQKSQYSFSILISHTTYSNRPHIYTPGKCATEVERRRK